MKTNHKRGYKQKEGAWAGKGANGSQHGYRKDFGEVAVDAEGNTISARAMATHDDNKHSVARGRKGAKKFVHSRVRRKDRDAIKSVLKKEKESD